MSALERDFLKAKLARLPLTLPDEAAAQHDDENDDQEEELQDGLGALPPIGVGKRKRRSAEYKPISGAEFFAEALSVRPPNGDTNFRVYYSPPKIAPNSDDQRGTVFVFHHGAGYSGLSFAQVANHMKAQSTEETPGFLAIDARGHGKTTGSDESNLSLETLSRDLCDILHQVFPVKAKAAKLVLVGHSMGGPVVVTACATIQKDIAHVIGVAMLDIVEGSAMEALQGMGKYIASQPKGFDSVEDAIAWHLSARQINNAGSAQVSVPPLVRHAREGESPHQFVWRTDLAASEQYWSGWFSDLSNKFLTVQTAKLLVLAGTDRLDTALTIGQMQGKFQLSVFGDVGHCLQEDAPERLASLLIEFWNRNDMVDILKHVKKMR